MTRFVVFCQKVILGCSFASSGIVQSFGDSSKNIFLSPWIAEQEKARLLQQEETSAIGYLIWFRVPRQSPAFWIFTTYSALTTLVRVVISAG
uniref:Uncharacterized protein n=1 Tax=Spironucleus salmonicida TaxID=348837 RepID=V6LBC7_9EUKA|eukprot:EST41553.1 Hypothetical protein SS50377_18891 [Spironucleus salmonicida]